MGLSLAATVIGCSPAASTGPATVSAGHALAVGSGVTTTVPVTTGDLIDIGIPRLSNLSPSTIRVLNIELKVASPEAKFRGFEAFSYARAGSGMLDGVGDLPVICPSLYRALDTTQRVILPRHAARWFAVVPVRVPKAGHYVVGPYQVKYQALDGSSRTYVQSFDLQETLSIKAGRAQHLNHYECGPAG